MLSVVQVRALITNKADFFHPGICSWSQVCRINSVYPQSRVALQCTPMAAPTARLTSHPSRSSHQWGQWHWPHKGETLNRNVVQPSFPNNQRIPMPGSQGHDPREDLEFTMWPWLLIGPYMNLVLCPWVQVPCPSKGTIILCRSPLVSFNYSVQLNSI